MRKSWTISSNVHVAGILGPDSISGSWSTMASRIDGALPQVPMITLILPG